jgi:hypothetical protein
MKERHLNEVTLIRLISKVFEEMSRYRGDHDAPLVLFITEDRADVDIWISDIKARLLSGEKDWMIAQSTVRKFKDSSCILIGQRPISPGDTRAFPATGEYYTAAKFSNLDGELVVNQSTLSEKITEALKSHVEGRLELEPA